MSGAPLPAPRRARGALRRPLCALLASLCLAPMARALPVLPPAPRELLGPLRERIPPISIDTGCRGIAARAASRSGPDAAPAAALEALQRAGADRERARAREALRRFTPGAIPSPLLVCAWLELAQAELALGLHPEAAASALRAERLAASSADPPARREDALFLRAEAELFSNQLAAAAARYRALRDSQRAELRAAAALREADLRYQRGELAAAFPAYRALLDTGSPAGASARASRERAAEAAIASGHLDLASLWLRQRIAELEDDTERSRALLRLADVRSEQHRPRDARRALAEAYALRKGRPEGWLALVRVYDLELEMTGPETTIGTLRRAVDEAGHPGVVRYAQVVLARRLIERGEHERGIRLLVGVQQDRLSAATSAMASAELPGAIARVAAKSGCRERVEVLGARQQLLQELVRVPAPFLQLGACYEELGLPEVAIGVYRGAGAQLGEESLPAFALALARANLGAGRITSARLAALRESLKPGADPDWHRILAEARLRSGEPETAAAGLLARAQGPEALGATELALLARAALQLPDAPELRGLLHTQLLRLSRATGAGPREELGHAALFAARRWRIAGGLPQAQELYALAYHDLPEGPLRAQAGYWAGRLAVRPEAAREQLAATAALAESPWTRLAAQELVLRGLRSELGLPEALRE